MIQIFTHANYDFVGKRGWYYALSVIGILISIASLVAHRGLAYGIDFSGGFLLQVRFERPVPVEAIRNDTIVVFDRIRERRATTRVRPETLAALVNQAINQTLSRTVLTSFTTFLAAFVLFVFGGEVLNDLAFTLVVGIVTGTYSSVAASAVLLDWETWSARRRRAAPALRRVSDGDKA